MIDKYLSNEFKGKELKELLDFMHSLGEDLNWSGGIIQNFQINTDFVYFVYIESDKQNIIFVKAKEYLGENVTLCGDSKSFCLSEMPLELKTQICNYKVVSVSKIKIEDSLNNEIVKQELEAL
jgi:hypothetical protein